MKKTAFFLLIILTLPLIAQSIPGTQLDLQITQHLFNGEWEKSDSLIELKYGDDSNLLKYNFLKAYNSFYTRYVGNNNPYRRDETIRQVEKYAWAAIEFGEKAEENLENGFYLGSSYSLLARVNIMSQNLWNAYWNASKAENYLEEVLDKNPSIHDAYLNLGIFEYFPAVAVSGYSSVLSWIGGMSGDAEEGIKKITRTSVNGNLFKDEAIYSMAIVSGRESDLVASHEYWKELSKKYPKNNNFLGQMNRTYVAKLVEEKGVEFLVDEFEDLDSVYNINNPNILNTLGYALVNQNRFDEALIVFEVNIKKYPDVANGYDSLAEYYMIRNDHQNAIKYYKIAFDKLKTDTTINDQFRERLEEGIRNNLREMGSNLDV